MTVFFQVYFGRKEKYQLMFMELKTERDVERIFITSMKNVKKCFIVVDSSNETLYENISVTPNSCAY